MQLRRRRALLPGARSVFLPHNPFVNLLKYLEI